MKKDLSTLKANITKAENALKAASRTGDRKLLQAVGPWLKEAKPEVESLEEDLEKTKEAVDDVRKRASRVERAPRRIVAAPPLRRAAAPLRRGAARLGAAAPHTRARVETERAQEAKTAVRSFFAAVGPRRRRPSRRRRREPGRGVVGFAGTSARTPRRAASRSSSGCLTSSSKASRRPSVPRRPRGDLARYGPGFAMVLKRTPLAFRRRENQPERRRRGRRTAPIFKRTTCLHGRSSVVAAASPRPRLHAPRDSQVRYGRSASASSRRRNGRRRRLTGGRNAPPRTRRGSEAPRDNCCFFQGRGELEPTKRLSLPPAAVLSDPHPIRALAS